MLQIILKQTDWHDWGLNRKDDLFVFTADIVIDNLKVYNTV
jgi:hypothetical protein